MNFDSERIQYLRNEAAIYRLDLERAQMQPAGDGSYTVHLNAPLFDLAPLLENVPRTVHARSAAAAEGEMLTWLMNIQRAERQKVRFGTRCGWSSDQINRRPLSDEEIAVHKDRIKRAAEMAKLQQELIELLESATKNAALDKAHAELEARYPMSAVQPANVCQTPAVNAPKRKGVRK
jgi:hypothetical protein